LGSTALEQERQTKDEEQQEPLAKRHRAIHLLSKTGSRQASGGLSMAKKSLWVGTIWGFPSNGFL
jgi:hypothetical protein